MLLALRILVRLVWFSAMLCVAVALAATMLMLATLRSLSR